MNAKARTARQIIKARQTATRDAKRPHTLASHAIRAGVPTADAAGVANAIRAKGKVTGITGTESRVFRRMANGNKAWRNPVAGARRYTKAEVLALTTAYNPRVARLVDAKQTVLAYAR